MASPLVNAEISICHEARPFPTVILASPSGAEIVPLPAPLKPEIVPYPAPLSSLIPAPLTLPGVALSTNEDPLPFDVVLSSAASTNQNELRLQLISNSWCCPLAPAPIHEVEIMAPQSSALLLFPGTAALLTSVHDVTTHGAVSYGRRSFQIHASRQRGHFPSLLLPLQVSPKSSLPALLLSLAPSVSTSTLRNKKNKRPLRGATHGAASAPPTAVESHPTSFELTNDGDGLMSLTQIPLINLLTN